ncbi:MAG: SAM-dependent methyltransferase, partial [Pseudomonadota bacterium]
FSLPDSFTGAFDLVHECYNLQAIDPERVPEALGCISETVKPGGRLLVITRAALNEGADKARQPGPPTPIARGTLERSVPSGLSRDRMDLFRDQREPPIPHWLGEWTRTTD